MIAVTSVSAFRTEELLPACRQPSLYTRSVNCQRSIPERRFTVSPSRRRRQNLEPAVTHRAYGKLQAVYTPPFPGEFG